MAKATGRHRAETPHTGKHRAENKPKPTRQPATPRTDAARLVSLAWFTK